MEFNNPYDPDAEDAEVTLDYNYGMLIDGETSDWDDIDPIIVDDTGEAYTAGVDIAEVKAVQDDENIYFYIRSANGTPLESYGSSFSIGFANYYDDDQYEKANFNFSNDGADRISTGGSYIYTTGGYEEYYDPETEEWYTYPSSYTESFSNPGIRFAGSTYGSDTLEYSIAKSLFWDNVGSGDSFSLDVNAYDSSYSDQDYASGMNIILNDGGTTPSYDEPGVQFVKNYDTLSIDGDMSDWNSDELWFRDFTDDDPYTGIDNTNIENVYVRHDDDCVYFLITLNDPGTLDSDTNINIYVTDENYFASHEFYAYFYAGGGDAYSAYLYYGGSYSSNCYGYFDEANGTVELQFRKYEVWDDLPYDALEYSISLSNSSDTASFRGSYKGYDDSYPTY